MFCNNCGSPNPDGSKFCSNCGSALAPQQQRENEGSLQMCTIEIFRESQMFLINPPINLSVTGPATTKRLSIANGETIALQLPPGTYELKFSQSMRKRILNIDLWDDIHIDVKWNRITGAIQANATQ